MRNANRPVIEEQESCRSFRPVFLKVLPKRSTVSVRATILQESYQRLCCRCLRRALPICLICWRIGRRFLPRRMKVDNLLDEPREVESTGEDREDTGE